MDAAAHLAQALRLLGFDGDPEMTATPATVAALLAEFVPRDPPAAQPIATACHDLVVIRDLEYHSLCAHHLLPFFGTATVVLRPDGLVAGLGWYTRLLDAFARRPQVQERLAAQVVQHLADTLHPSAVGVRLTARQMCVEMRGARARASFEVTAWRGDPDPEARRALLP